MEIKEKLKEYWETKYDKIYCIFYTGNKAKRLENLEKELDRVGILHANNFTYYYDVPSPFDVSMYENIKLYYPQRDEKTLWIKKLAMNHYRISKISYELGYNRILIFEDDIRFLKDLNELYNILINEPENADITLFDKMIWRISKNIYNMVFGNQLYLDYSNFDLQTLAFSSAAFYGLSRKGMNEIIVNNENALTAGDTYTNNVKGLSKLIDAKKYVANINCGMQEEPKHYKDHYCPFVDFSKYNLSEQPKFEKQHKEKYNFIKI